jgi:hypothetical protein
MMHSSWLQNFQGNKQIEYLVNKNICCSYQLLTVVQCFSLKVGGCSVGPEIHQFVISLKVYDIVHISLPWTVS